MTERRRPEPGTYVYLTVALAVVAALLLVAFGAWQLGSTVAGVAMVVAAVVRGAVPERSSGLLRVRRRTSDVVTMLVLGAALVTLAMVVPTPPA